MDHGSENCTVTQPSFRVFKTWRHYFKTVRSKGGVQQNKVDTLGKLLRLTSWCIDKLLIFRYAVDSCKMPPESCTNSCNKVKTTALTKHS